MEMYDVTLEGALSGCRRPRISVIVPVHNGASVLGECLSHLRDSTVNDFECLVIDDGSSDGSGAIAAAYGARVITTDHNRGPAHARNVGSRAAQSDILLFIDADILVHPNTLKLMVDSFRGDPTLDAMFGSYDDLPASKDFISQYRNLMHFYVHQHGRHHATTFWSGCGAIRRDVFLRCNGFDESYRRPAIEDIELGYRLTEAGYKIILNPDVQVTHLKRWTLWSVIKTDIWDRGVPWTELILRDKRLPNDLNVQVSQRLSVALVFIMLSLAVLTVMHSGFSFVIPVLAILACAACRYWIDPGRPLSRTIVSLVLACAVITVLAWYFQMTFLMYPVLMSYILVTIRDRYRASLQTDASADLLVGVYIGFTLMFLVWQVPLHRLTAAFFAALISVIVLNRRFYTFLAFNRRGRPLFALTVIPFHLLYYCYNGIAVVIGAFRYLIRQQFAPQNQECEPPPDVACTKLQSP
jgi:glycosyltransferase involved in cell wall biosynthesis